jgi:hypothetical protein
LGCDAIYSGKNVQMLQRNLLPYLWSRRVHSDNGASRFLWNIGALIPDCVVSHTRRLYLFIMCKYILISYWINCFCCVYQIPYAVNFRFLFTFFVKVHFTSVCYFVLQFSVSELCVCHLSKVLYRHLQSGEWCHGIVSAFEPILFAPYWVLMMQYFLLSVVITMRLQIEDASAETYSDDCCVYSYVCVCDFFIYNGGLTCILCIEWHLKSCFSFIMSFFLCVCCLSKLESYLHVLFVDISFPR